VLNALQTGRTAPKCRVQHCIVCGPDRLSPLLAAARPRRPRARLRQLRDLQRALQGLHPERLGVHVHLPDCLRAGGEDCVTCGGRGCSPRPPPAARATGTTRSTSRTCAALPLAAPQPSASPFRTLLTVASPSWGGGRAELRWAGADRAAQAPAVNFLLLRPLTHLHQEPARPRQQRGGDVLGATPAPENASQRLAPRV
jgi:hypothetical protein